LQVIDTIGITITDLKEIDGADVWSIVVAKGSEILEASDYHTNRERCGLWKNHQQVLGTFEFCLPNDLGQAAEQIQCCFAEKWQYGLSKRLSGKTTMA
jgi:hypothetical protein